MIRNSIYTDCGGRTYNEDTAAVYQKEDAYCAVVADGLGGHGGGKDASCAATSVLEAEFFTGKLCCENKLSDCFTKANKAVLEIQTQACQMKTTLVVACIDEKGKIARWAHVGDSRLYHFVNGKIEHMTFDHSVSQMAVLMGEIKQEEIRHHVDRNKLLRAIGNDDAIRAEVSEEYSIAKGRHAFLLCTDGFWEYVLEEEMQKTLIMCRNPEQWIARMVRLLKRRIPPSNDNNTAVALWNY